MAVWGVWAGIDGDGSMLTVSYERAKSNKESIEGGSDWLSLHEDRVYELLKTLGVCGYRKLQQTIEEHCGITIGRNYLETFLERAYGKNGRLHSIAMHDKAMKAVRDSAYDNEVEAARPIYDKLLKLFADAPLTIATLMGTLSQKFAITISPPAASRLLVRMQWHQELSMEFLPAAYRPLLHSTDVFDWPMQYGVSSWTFCSMCGRRQPRKQSAAIGVQFECPKTIISICPKAFSTGCSFDCYRQRDLETNGATPINAKYEVQSIVQWRLQQRRLWNLDELPRHYDTVASYAQPQGQDWPVYDPAKKVYVECTDET